MEISIKKASLNDFEDIEYIECHNEIILPLNTVKEELYINKSVYFIAKNYNLCIGFISCDINYDHADITALLVDKTYRNLKIASDLINHLKFYLAKENIFDILLEVRSSNTKAINLYTKNGFKFIAKRANYYDDDDAYVYKYTTEH